jgi:hypothetical protein
LYLLIWATATMPITPDGKATALARSGWGLQMPKRARGGGRRHGAYSAVSVCLDKPSSGLSDRVPWALGPN